MGFTTAAAVVGGVASVASAGMSMFGGDDGASDQADAYAGQSAALAKEQVALAKKMWQRYEDAFIPVENQLITDTNVPVKEMPGYIQSMGNINKQYMTTGAGLRRTMGGRYQYGSGLERLSAESNYRARNKALSSNYADWDTNRYNRLFNLASLGRGNATTAQSGLNSAAGITGSLMNTYANAAQASAQSSGNAASALGSLGSLGMMYALGAV